MSRLHCITPWQGRKPSVLSEELLLAQKREEKTYVFVPPFFGFSKMLLEDCLHFIQAIPHFWQKKMAARFFSLTRYSETHFELKTSEFRCEMKF